MELDSTLPTVSGESAVPPVEATADNLDTPMDFTQAQGRKLTREKSPAKKRQRQDEGAARSEPTMPLAAVELLDRGEAGTTIFTSAFLQFLSDVKGNDQPFTVARRFTSDVPGLISMLQSIMPAVKAVRAINSRVRRLVSTLGKAQAYFDATGDEQVVISRSNSLESVASNGLE